MWEGDGALLGVGRRRAPPPQLQSEWRLQVQLGSIFNISAETLNHPQSTSCSPARDPDVHTQAG